MSWGNEIKREACRVFYFFFCNEFSKFNNTGARLFCAIMVLTLNVVREGSDELAYPHSLARVLTFGKEEIGLDQLLDIWAHWVVKEQFYTHVISPIS